MRIHDSEVLARLLPQYNGMRVSMHGICFITGQIQL